MTDEQLADIMEEARLIAVESEALSGRTELLLKRLRDIMREDAEVDGLHITLEATTSLQDLLTKVFRGEHV
jgi:hypothetical protein